MTRQLTLVILVIASALLPCCGEDGPASFTAPKIDVSGFEPTVATAITQRVTHAEDEKTPEAIAHLARVLHAHKLYTEAADLYDIALERGGNEFRNLYLRGCALKIIDPERALTVFQAALKVRSDDPPLLLRLGLLQEQLGNHDRARVHLKRAAELRDYGQAHLGLGRIALKRGAKKAAVEYLKVAVEKLPEDGAPYEALARAFKLSNKPLSAGKAAKVAAHQATTKSGFPDPIMATVVREGVSFANNKSRSNSHLNAGHLDQALDWINRALKIQPDNPDGLFDKATILHVQEKHIEALALCTEILKTRPDMADAADLSSHCLKKLGRIGEAVNVLNTALESNPNDLHLRCSLAFFLMNKDSEAARTHLQAAIKANPLSQQARIQYAGFLASEHKFTEAEAEYLELLSYYPLNNDLRMQLCSLYGNQQKWALIRVQLKKIVERNPTHAAARALWEKILGK